MNAYIRIILAAAAILLTFGAQGGAAWAEATPDQEIKQPATRKVVLVIIDGLQAEYIDANTTPCINGLGMAGVRVDRVSFTYPDDAGTRLNILLRGDAKSEARLLPLIMEGKGIKTALVDGTGLLEREAKGISHALYGPFAGKQDAVNDAVKLLAEKRPFLTVVVLSGRNAAGETPAGREYAGAMDNEVGRLVRQLHIDGTYEQTLLVVAGTSGSPPLIIKGNDFLTGTRLPAADARDMAATIGYLYGLDMPGSSGMVLWNSLQPTPKRTEKFMLMQRVNDLSVLYALKNEENNILVEEKNSFQKEKDSLARERLRINRQIEARDREISDLKLKAQVMKICGIVLAVLFMAALYTEYRVLKKRYLFFT